MKKGKFNMINANLAVSVSNDGVKKKHTWYVYCRYDRCCINDEGEECESYDFETMEEAEEAMEKNINSVREAWYENLDDEDAEMEKEDYQNQDGRYSDSFIIDFLGLRINEYDYED